MNPFQTYPGIRLNGVFYPNQDLEKVHKMEKLSEMERDVLEFAAMAFNNDSKISVKTSGSTGKPKDQIFRKKAFLTSARATNAFFDLGENSTALLALPMRYIAGKMMAIRAIAGQYELKTVAPTGNPFAEIDGKHISFVPITPFQASQILSQNPEKLAQVGAVLIGGGQVSNELKTQLKEAGVRAFASFGMTETLSHFALADLGSDAEDVRYAPLKGVTLKTDRDGSLRVKWAEITNGWLQTNDLVKIYPDGFEWLGRTDNLINSGGVKVIPEVVEKRISALLDVPYFIAGIPHKSLGEALTLFVETDKKGLAALNLSEIQHALADKPFWHPRSIVRMKAFKYTASGKIRRQKTLESWQKKNKKA